MKNLNLIISFFFINLLIIVSGCHKEYQLGDIVAPSNVTLNYEIVGADEENPYGDGSGVVQFTATSDNEITYKFSFGDGKDDKVAADGKISHTFSLNGINTFNVTVHAVGTGGNTSTKSTQVEVISNFSDEGALLFLTGGSSKSWYWAADQPGHLGLGPNNFDYEPGSWTWPQWYQAAPWENIESSLYECVLVCTKLENGQMRFEHMTPTGEAFIQGLYSEALGLGPEGSYPWDIEGVKNATFSPSESIATIDGDYRGTTLNYSDGGFMGFYAGTSEYEIMEVTDNILAVRIVQANEPLFAWYHIFTTEKPVQK